MQSITLQELTVLARLVLPKGIQRTDTQAGEFEANFYKSGDQIIMQVFDHDAQVWRSVVLS